MWAQWIPWRFVIRAAARQKGFIDPLTLLSKFQNFIPLTRAFINLFHRDWTAVGIPDRGHYSLADPRGLGKAEQVCLKREVLTCISL